VILGDRDELAIEVERFEAPWSTVDPQQESLWGALTMWIAGENVTEHRRCGSDRVRDELHLPLLPLARWFLSVRAALGYEERSPLGTGGSPHEDLDRWSEGPAPAGHTEDGWLGAMSGGRSISPVPPPGTLLLRASRSSGMTIAPSSVGALRCCRAATGQSSGRRAGRLLGGSLRSV